MYVMLIPQDTVMVLQALSAYGIKFQEVAFDGNVKVRDTTCGEEHNVDISGSRSLLLQSVEVRLGSVIGTTVGQEMFADMIFPRISRI